ncbi:MAG TPA: DUF4833 domain-containing protein [Saprospiraceae bacterium]|nr:DUF4833 domain-containing protein [Saprospiraceae bacterium]HPN71796.1 DUF4833 domain-containing protein [Saprospiraceae bacterium]
MMKKKYNSDILDQDSLEGRPVNYPFPKENNQLFFIQRNHNTNTVVYTVNYQSDGMVNLNEPMSIYWIKYNDSSKIELLNLIQNALAYGYKSEVINGDLIQFKFVCHKRSFYLAKIDGTFKVFTVFDGVNYVVKNIYVHAEEFGAFPVVNFVEIYGLCPEGKDVVKRIEF